jgi:DNA invertase Pin-like site-specific DNA recombinase
MDAPGSAAIYARQSIDHDQGIADQMADCRALAEREGWTIGAEYVDNDVSASKGKPRPGYIAMLADIAAGKRDGLIFTHNTRLHRSTRELDDFIGAVGDLPIRSVRAGTYDLTTANGRYMARQLGLLAQFETDLLGERLARRFLQNATEGKPHGRPAYGWRRLDGRDIADPVEAPVVREIVARLLAGESVSSIAAWLNSSGIVPPRHGKKDAGDGWTRSTVRQIALRPSNAGLRVHRGQVVGMSQAESLISEADHKRVVVLIRDPNRQSRKGNRPTHLLSGLAVCDLCEQPVERQGLNDKRPGRNRIPIYLCRDCLPEDDAVARGEAPKGARRAWSVRRAQEPIDKAVSEAVVRRLSQPDAAGLFAAPGADTDGLMARRREIEADLDALTDMLTSREIGQRQFARASATYLAQLDDIDDELARTSPVDLTDLAGPEAAARWAAAPMDRKRAAVRALMTVRIKPRAANDPLEDGTLREEAFEVVWGPAQRR